MPIYPNKDTLFADVREPSAQRLEELRSEAEESCRRCAIAPAAAPMPSGSWEPTDRRTGAAASDACSGEPSTL